MEDDDQKIHEALFRGSGDPHVDESGGSIAAEFERRFGRWFRTDDGPVVLTQTEKAAQVNRLGCNSVMFRLRAYAWIERSPREAEAFRIDAPRVVAEVVRTQVAADDFAAPVTTRWM